jgi:hypothetical protein
VVLVLARPEVGLEDGCLRQQLFDVHRLVAHVGRIEQLADGTSSGGTLRKRNSPSTRSVSFLTARRLVLRGALTNGLANEIRPFAPSFPASRSTSSLAARRSYQTSRWLSFAKPRIPSRYSRTQALTIRLRWSVVSPTSRPAISTLAAMRLTSHSHGPGSVSSKSFGPKTSLRSGAAKPPKFEMCASPHACTTMPESGVAARSAAMTAAAPR